MKQEDEAEEKEMQREKEDFEKEQLLLAKEKSLSKREVFCLRSEMCIWISVTVRVGSVTRWTRKIRSSSMSM